MATPQSPVDAPSHALKSRNQRIASWIMRIIIAAGFTMTGFIPKLTGAPESIELFNKLGAGDPGRYFTAIVELAATILILLPKTVPVGAALVIATMLGALASHAAIIGFEDHYGPLALMALALLALAVATLFLHRRHAFAIARPLLGKARK